MKNLSKLEPIVENVVTKRLRKTLDICAKRNMLTLIFGETGRGKTLTAAHWCARRPNARHIMLDASTSQAMLVRRLARELLGECRGSTEENKNAIERYLLDNETILVIDEANQLLEPPSLSAKKKNMEYLRLNLWEKTRTPVALIFTFGVRMIRVDGESMLPTLQDGQRLMITSYPYTPQRGDIVVIDAYTAYGDPLVKRVIGIEGDTIDIDFQNGIVYLNGEALEEPYTAEPTYLQESVTFPVTVPEGCLFVMGDNRNHSTDSRDDRVGFVDERDVLGRLLRQ